jgi:quinol-cytochrome oxidoreductase complex cytochrome b subunit
MNTFYSWLDRRFPFREIIHEHLTGYYAPKNFNILYYFGSMALLVLLIQILSGIFLLTMPAPPRPSIPSRPLCTTSSGAG